MLRDRLGNADDIGFLKGIRTDQIGGHIPCDDHQRHGIHMGCRDAGYEVGSAGAGSRKAYSGFPGGPGISVRRMDGSLLVSRQQVAEIRIVVHGVVDIEDSPPG